MWIINKCAELLPVSASVADKYSMTENNRNIHVPAY
jgi:hypothetical protein